MSSVVLSGDTSGSITLSAPAIAGSSTQTLAAVTGTLAPVVRGTVATATGTSVDFTGIPSWVKRVTVMLSGVSSSGTSNWLIQVGAGSVENTGYVSMAQQSNGLYTSTAGFIFAGTPVTAAQTYSGAATILNINSNDWISTGILSNSDSAQAMWYSGGRKTTSGTLDRIRITTVNGTDTFDAGSINILYE